MKSAPRIAFVELWRLGDAVAATAGLETLARAVPDSEIAIIAHPINGEPLFRLLPRARHIPFAAFWTRGKVARDKYLPWTIDYGAIRQVRRAIDDFSPDYCLLFRGDVREQLFLWPLRSGKIVDFPGRFGFLPSVVRIDRPKAGPRFKEYVHLVQTWSNTTASAEPQIAGDHVDTMRSGSFILVHPGASWRFKQWSENYFATVIRSLTEKQIEVRLIGSTGDSSVIKAINGQLEKPVEVIVPSLADFYRYVGASRLVICNNSAALHIAEALNIPCIAITGPNDPVRWGTYRSHSRTLEKSVGLACHPCKEKRCVRPSDPCIQFVTPADVIKAMVEIGVLEPDAV